MDKIKFAAGAAIVAIAAAFASCSGDDDISNGGYTDNDVVRVTADVSEMATRASYTTTNLDRFGMSIDNIENKSYSYDNVEVGKENGGWTTFSLMRWQNDSTPVDIVAYAPYNEDYTYNIATATAFPVTLPTTQAEDSKDADFLIFKAANFVPKTGLQDGKVHVSFKHAMSQVNVKVNFNDEFEEDSSLTANPVTKFAAGGTVTTGVCDFSLEAPAVTPIGGSSATDVEGHYVGGSFTAATESARPSARYSCIVIPQATSEFSLSFVIGGKTYTWRAPGSVTFEAGKRYSLELNAGKDMVVVGGITSTPWVETEEQNLKTD